MAITNADAVASYLIRFVHDHGDCITNLKLQKLIYYAQAWYLALYDAPLFDERLEAWVHGPVQPEVYYRFKRHGWNPIPDDVGRPQLPDLVKQHLHEVMEEYGTLSAYELERMTHAEMPWRKARGGLPPDAWSDAVISQADMKGYYKGRLRGEGEAES